MTDARGERLCDCTPVADGHPSVRAMTAGDRFRRWWLRALQRRLGPRLRRRRRR